jgi:hypothetical protein
MNEYLARFLELTGGDPQPDRFGRIMNYERIRALIHARYDMVMQYAWAIPDEYALDLLAKHGPIVEMGAGGGYWAMLLRGMGVDVAAYDSLAGDHNVQSSYTWTEVERGTPRSLQAHGDRTLFLCWPPYDTRMADLALRRFEQAGGERLIYIGEHAGGCTGDDRFHDQLAKRWQETDTLALPQWPMVHDYLSVWVRKPKS